MFFHKINTDVCFWTPDMEINNSESSFFKKIHKVGNVSISTNFVFIYFFSFPGLLELL